MNAYSNLDLDPMKLNIIQLFSYTIMCSDFMFLDRFLLGYHSNTHTHTHSNENEYPIGAFSKNATIIILTYHNLWYQT